MAQRSVKETFFSNQGFDSYSFSKWFENRESTDQRYRFTVAEQQCYAEAALPGAAGAEGLKNLEGKKGEKKRERPKEVREE